VIVAANKAEGPRRRSGRLEAYALGLGEPIAISAEHGEGVADLFERCARMSSMSISRADAEARDEEAGAAQARHRRPAQRRQVDPGQPMLGEERMITGPEAGITRDSISHRLDWWPDGRPVRLVDTAGLRKRAKVEDKLERCRSPTPAARSIYAEVVVLLLDARAASRRRT
jgi:GTP-binding protein